MSRGCFAPFLLRGGKKGGGKRIGTQPKPGETSLSKDQRKIVKELTAKTVHTSGQLSRLIVEKSGKLKENAILQLESIYKDLVERRDSGHTSKISVSQSCEEESVVSDASITKIPSSLNTSKPRGLVN